MQKSSLGIPIAIVIGAGVIAAALYFSGKPAAPAANEPQGENPAEAIVEPVTEDDHIRGNPNAPIMLVEYSDYDCPYCKNFHETMNQVMVEYGTNGQVAWVYRHFPLEQLHPNAPKISEASECVAELGGNEAFWTFTDLIFESRDINEATDVSQLPAYAAEAGVDETAFASCLSSGKYTAAIQEDVEGAIAAGGRGTPHTIVLVNGEQAGPINGAQPFSVVRKILDQIIESMENESL